MANETVRTDGITVDGLARKLRDGQITRRGFLAAAAGLLGSMAAAEGLIARVAGAQTTSKTEVVVAQGGDLSKMDPHLTTSGWDLTILMNLYDNLTSRHPDGKVYPGLATEWKLVNPTLWQFKLRQGVKFHNGDPFTAADVKFSIERAYDPTRKISLVRTNFQTIDHIETPDPLTVNFYTKKPDLLLPARFSFSGGQIMSKKYVEAVGDETFNLKPVATGPIEFKQWIKDDRVVMDANRDYFLGKIDVDRAIFRPIPEMAARISALLAGEVDLITKLPPDHADRVAKHPNTKVEGALYAGLYVLQANSKRPPLDNPKVKQALSLAIDRESIVKDLFRGQGIVPSQPIAKGDNHFDENLPPLKYDPNLAKQRLKEAGYKGEEVVIESGQGLIVYDKEMGETVVSMWRGIGVNAKLEILETTVRAQKLREKTFKGFFWADPTS
ncbi:MAG TPA: ABC transporter substrate-binding protein, partial [Candidatus Acidoferrum sp.]|nr:ABC transporter substrate-binding protein [Candidatus Acidoferrum sp.]